MPRIESANNHGLEQDEADAACALLNLAETIHDSCHRLTDQEWIPPVTVRALHKAYRAIRPVVNFYWGAENVPLFWDPPITRFQKAKAKC
jgi:hypothetical protein